jgi:hypothetical protein
MAGQTTEQGYGWRHQQERARWVKFQEDGGDDERGGLLCRADPCIEATSWIQPGEAWDLGHDPGQRRHRGPEHVSCNRSAGARQSNRGGNPGRAGARARRRRRARLPEVSVDPSDL